MKSRVLSAGLIVLLLAANGCGSRRIAHVAGRPLVPGYYYMFTTPGVYRRIIVSAGVRAVSYDIWRVSRSDNDNAKHLHFDLIGTSASPESGSFAITQDGSDCGSAWLQPYNYHGAIVDSIILFDYKDVPLPFLSGGRAAAPDTYPAEDALVTSRIANFAASTPTYYSNLNFWQRAEFNFLEPRCSF